MWPVEPVDVSLFANPWNPNNPEGSRPSVENFADLVNTVPKMGAVYADSTRNMYNLYERLLKEEAVAVGITFFLHILFKIIYILYNF